LRPGSHLDLIGSFTPQMREADDDCFANASVFVDTDEAAKKSGELLGPMSRGILAERDIRGTLAGLCQGSVPGRQFAGKRTVFKSVGTPLEDLAAAILVYESPRQEAVGLWVGSAPGRGAATGQASVRPCGESTQRAGNDAWRCQSSRPFGLGLQGGPCGVANARRMCFSGALCALPAPPCRPNADPTQSPTASSPPVAACHCANFHDAHSSPRIMKVISRQGSGNRFSNGMFLVPLGLTRPLRADLLGGVWDNPGVTDPPDGNA